MTNHFTTWQATRMRSENLPEELGIDEDCCSRTGYVYDGGYIEERDEIVRGKDDRYYLLIERSDWLSDSLTEMEEILWSQWAIYESSTAPTVIRGDDLDAFVRGVCHANGYRIDGDVFGLAFARLGYEGDITPHAAEEIVHQFARIYSLKPQPAVAQPVGTPFGV